MVEKDPDTARIDFDLIQTITEKFPDKGEWKKLKLQPTPRNRPDRQSLHDVREKGGNYAFLIPKSCFNGERKIELAGPKQQKIPFCFSAHNHHDINGDMVVYVGKSTNLCKRFKSHFSGGKQTTTTQVRDGLKNSGICTGIEEAISLMFQQACIFYHVLHGVEHTANRDLLELSLCAKFAPPFNIKSER